MNRILDQVIPAEAVPGVVDVSEQRIIVAVDLSENSEKTASYAIALAKSFGASIIFVHVFPRETNAEFTTDDIHWRYARERDAAKCERRCKNPINSPVWGTG